MQILLYCNNLNFSQNVTSLRVWFSKSSGFVVNVNDHRSYLFWAQAIHWDPFPSLWNVRFVHSSPFWQSISKESFKEVTYIYATFKFPLTLQDCGCSLGQLSVYVLKSCMLSPHSS